MTPHAKKSQHSLHDSHKAELRGAHKIANGREGASVGVFWEANASKFGYDHTRIVPI